VSLPKVNMSFISKMQIWSGHSSHKILQLLPVCLLCPFSSLPVGQTLWGMVPTYWLLPPPQRGLLPSKCTKHSECSELSRSLLLFIPSACIRPSLWFLFKKPYLNFKT
jgi:hypothetical protein